MLTEEGINKDLKSYNPQIYAMLSKRGREIAFPTKGIVAQSLDAKHTTLNATIGIALDEKQEPICLSAMQKAIPSKEVLRYASSFGVHRLRVLGETDSTEEFTLHNEMSLPVVTSGITHALSMAGYLFVEEKDTIVLSDLFWGNYRLIFEKTYGGKLTEFTLFDDHGFNLNAFEKAINTKDEKIILLLNFPNNPTGYSPTQVEAKEIVKIILKQAQSGTKIVVLCDDAYFGLTYEENVERESLFSYLASLHENVLAVKIDGATKEDFVWGLRVGFITFAGKGLHLASLQALEDKVGGAIRATISNASHLSQCLVQLAFEDKEYMKQKEEIYSLLKGRYMLVKTILEEIRFSKYFKALPFNSGYFMCLQLNEGIDAEKVRTTLLRDFNTGVIVTKGLIRIAFSSVPTHKLKELFENIYRACEIVSS